LIRSEKKKTMMIMMGHDDDNFSFFMGLSILVLSFLCLSPPFSPTPHHYFYRAYDYIPNMMSPIDNMIGHATDLILASVEPTSGQPYVALIFSMVEKVFSNTGRSNQRESVCATHLVLR